MSTLPVQRRASLFPATPSEPVNRSPVFISFCSNLKQLLRRPQSFPILLSIFLFLTWFFLKIQSSSSSSSSTPSLPKFYDSQLGSHSLPSNFICFRKDSLPLFKDKRGWLVNPVSLASEYGIKGGANSCASIHAGEIRPGSMRGNHRHHDTNETLVIWGAKTLFRLEKREESKKNYGEVVINADEVAVATSPSGTAHLLLNIDSVQSTFFIGCQDSIISYNSSSTDFNVWTGF